MIGVDIDGVYGSESLDTRAPPWWTRGLAQHWDAGDMGCGQLVMVLRRRVSELEPGEQLEVVARSPGAPVDLPAWCRMTGHKLIRADHPTYVIERRTD